MSFSGFVFDMIRRNKENRDLLTLRRERMKDLQGKMYRKGTLQNPNVTLEELEKIEKATREKEKAEPQYYLRATLIFLTVTAILALILWWILQHRPRFREPSVPHPLPFTSSYLYSTDYEHKDIPLAAYGRIGETIKENAQDYGRCLPF